MRLSYLDILEQCFHDKFRGYNKQEVDTFLHLVADDFKSMSEEIKEKERIIANKDNEIKVLLADLESRPAEIDNNIPQEVEKKLTHLRKQIKEKDQFIKEMQESQRQGKNGDNPFSQLTPEILKQKAKKANLWNLFLMVFLPILMEIEIMILRLDLYYGRDKMVNVL